MSPENDRYKLRAVAMDWTECGDIENATTPAVAQAARNYNSSIVRTQSLVLFPAYLIGAATRQARLRGIAECETWGRVRWFSEGEITEQPHSQADIDKYNQNFDRASDDFAKVAGGVDWLFEKGHDYITDISSLPNPGRITDGIEAMLASTIFGVWSAFEVLVSDLWKAVLTDCPGFVFDPLQKQAKYSLQTLSKMRKLFNDAFESNSSMAKIFGHESFDDLAAVRNCFIHVSGRTDPLFFQQIKTNQVLKSLGVGASIQLDGSLVNDLVVPVMKKSVELIHAVNVWIADNLKMPRIT